VHGEWEMSDRQTLVWVFVLVVFFGHIMSVYRKLSTNIESMLYLFVQKNRSALTA